MPSYTIHLAVAERYLERHRKENKTDFILGVIDPDLLEKPASHYGPASSKPNLKRYLEEVGLNNSYQKGYFLHLLTDKLFYNDFLPGLITEFTKEIYRDYNRINLFIIEKYSLDIPCKIKDKVKYESSPSVILSQENITEFIEVAAKTAEEYMG